MKDRRNECSAQPTERFKVSPSTARLAAVPLPEGGTPRERLYKANIYWVHAVELSSLKWLCLAAVVPVLRIGANAK